MTTIAMRARFLVYRARTAAVRGAPAWRRAANGATMWIDPADPVDRAFVAGNFAHELRRHIRGFLRPGQVAIDAGAQKGFISLALARAVGPGGRVLAIEPDPRALATLRRNRERNPAAPITVIDCALAEADGEAEFLLSSQLGWSSLHHHHGVDSTLAGRVKVRTRPLDDLAGDLDRLDFVKIDCQGGEPAILRGMRRTVARHAPDIWLEVDHDGLRGAGADEAELGGLLAGMGYRIFLPRLVRRWQVPVGVRYEPVDSLPVRPGDYDILAVRAGSRTEAALRARR